MPNNLHILILEDNPADAELILYELRRAGFSFDWQRVDTQSDYLAHLDPTLDIILADYSLPQFSALEAMQLLQERQLDIPLIVVTGSVSEEAAVECMKQGASDYLLKDRLARLAPAVTQALEAKRLRDERRLTASEIQRRNRELTLLYEIIVAASDTLLEPQRLLSKACLELALAFGLPHVVAFLFDDERHTANIVAEHSPPDWEELVDSTYPLGRSPIFQHVLSRKSPILIAETAPQDPRLTTIPSRATDILLGHRATASMLVLPLTIEGKVTGCLALRDTEPYEFTFQQAHLAWRVADQISSAMARAQLDKERRLLTTAIQQTAESVIITDTEGVIVYVNPGFEQITGYSRDEAIGNTPSMLKSAEHDDGFYRRLWDTLLAGQRWRGRIINRRQDGSTYTVDCSIAPVRDERGRIVNYVDVQRDITHELQLEEQYLRAQKMEAVGRLAGGIAHDFNNVLTAIKGYTGLLIGNIQEICEQAEANPSQDTGELQVVQQDLEEIDRATDQAATLIRRLMAFTRKQVLQPEILNLNDVVTNAHRMLQRLIGEDIALTLNLTPALSRVKADPGQIEQVIMNLAVNARDAMPEGGELLLETHNVSFAANDGKRPPSLVPGEYIMLVVSDTGTGMDQDVLSHLFEPFFTTKEVGKGTGLGLATVHNIVSQNDGAIKVSSALGFGTTFMIYLPSADQTAPLKPETSQSKVLPTGQETIMVVEDDAFVRELTTRILCKQGYTVLTASHPEEALHQCSEHDGALELLLTDVVMPGMSGTELAQRITATRTETRVLYVSGYTDASIAENDILEPTVAFLQKPFTAEALALEVRRILDHP